MHHNDGVSLVVSVAVNEQIWEVILMPGNNAILVVYQINTRYNTYAPKGLCVVQLILINDSLKEDI